MNNDWPSLMVHLKVAANSEGETLQRSLTAAAVGEDPSVRRCRAATRQAIGQALARPLARAGLSPLSSVQIPWAVQRSSGGGGGGSLIFSVQSSTCDVQTTLQ